MSIGDKSELRRTIRRLTASLTSEQKSAESALIEAALLARKDVAEAETVALFLSLDDEPQMRGVIDALAATHRVVVPRIDGDEMEFAVYSPATLHIGAFGIEEPAEGETVPPADIDLMIVPGVAFTREGARLGRGRGYYDRYRARKGFRAFCIGVCFAEQIVGHIPTEPHDKAVDEVVSA
ncbi:MAG: 5-formyltetrahydrofolate cyclo-ligase [Alistipes sp.]